MSELGEGLDPDRMPRHVGIILDGNGRWAEQRDLPRTAGHAAGEKALFDAIQGALDLGIEWLTVYTFSTENWSRSEEEVTFLMYFNQDLLLRRRDDLHADGVRIYFMGDLDDLRVPELNRVRMRDAETLTAQNERLHLVFAFNYGSRLELADAARRMAGDALSGALDPDTIDPQTVSSYLYVPEMPDVDLVIRTSGEHRLSNFLLWQAAYAEFVFPEVLFPDFTPAHLAECVAEYQRRKRRFGRA
ncbi:MAG: polyprenyl diphosphate synthase [Acidimicrobiia bacterium]|nr:polyprenyl diphosphate synthase [Acidimicrobiia bacterium]MDH3397643.1 polyprenyl diphosphate synthase [Acidimicrobiia bacterium]